MKGRSLSRRQVMRQLSCAAGAVTLGASGLGWALRDALAEENAPWSYADPAQWPHLAPACGGTRQSPVDLGTAAPAEADALAFNWSPFAADLAHNGHTLQVAPRAGTTAGGITLGNTVAVTTAANGYTATVSNASISTGFTKCQVQVGGGASAAVDGVIACS